MQSLTIQALLSALYRSLAVVTTTPEAKITDVAVAAGHVWGFQYGYGKRFRLLNARCECCEQQPDGWHFRSIAGYRIACCWPAQRDLYQYRREALLLSLETRTRRRRKNPGDAPGRFSSDGVLWL